MHLVFLGAEREQEEKEDAGTGEGKGRLAEVEGRGGREGGGPEGRKEPQELAEERRHRRR